MEHIVLFVHGKHIESYVDVAELCGQVGGVALVLST